MRYPGQAASFLRKAQRPNGDRAERMVQWVRNTVAYDLGCALTPRERLWFRVRDKDGASRFMRYGMMLLSLYPVER